MRSYKGSDCRKDEILLVLLSDRFQLLGAITMEVLFGFFFWWPKVSKCLARLVLRGTCTLPEHTCRVHAMGKYPHGEYNREAGQESTPKPCVLRPVPWLSSQHPWGWMKCYSRFDLWWSSVYESMSRLELGFIFRIICGCPKERNSVFQRGSVRSDLIQYRNW